MVFIFPSRRGHVLEKDLSEAERVRIERAEGERESEAEIGAAISSLGKLTACFFKDCPSPPTSGRPVL